MLVDITTRGHDDDFERCWREASEQLGQFGLKLRPEKTRLIDG